MNYHAPASAVSEETIVNCFRKANISSSNQRVAETDADDPFKSLLAELERLREVDPNSVQEDLSAESFITLDNEVITSAPIITDDVILSDIIDDADDDLEKDEEDIPPPSRPSNREIEESLDKLRDLSLFSTHGDEIQSLTLKLEVLLDKERLQNLQQRQVTDYFVKY